MDAAKYSQILEKKLPPSATPLKMGTFQHDSDSEYTVRKSIFGRWIIDIYRYIEILF